MSYKENYEIRTEELLCNFAEENGLEIVDVEFIKEGPNWYLRIYIDKPGGVLITDCEKLSRYIDPILDQENFISQQYILEVSSPGLTRPLKKDKDFERHIDKFIELKLFKPINGYKNFVGELKSFDKDKIVLFFEEDEIKEIVFDRTNIKSAKPVVLF